MYKYSHIYIEDILGNVPLENWSDYQNHKFKAATFLMDSLHILQIESSTKKAAKY